MQSSTKLQQVALSKAKSFAVGLLLCAAATSSSAQAPSAEQIASKSLQAYYYGGKDMKARVSMRLVNAQGALREREMIMLRANTGESGDQRYLILFDAPADVRGMSFLVWKNAKGEDERWLYFPALKAVKRVAADDKRSSFVGSDFTYEDVSGRDTEDETHALLRQEELGGRKVYVLESKPKESAEYAKRLSWVDQERWLTLKEEYYDPAGKPVRTFTAEKVEIVGTVWTVTKRTMVNAQTGHRTEVVLSNLQYDSNLPHDIFTERQLRNPAGVPRP